MSEGFSEVDWSKTYAYAIGLGGIYLNFKGRERGGILGEGAEAERVRKAIQSGLAEFPDTEAQRPAMLVNFYPGFRVSWRTAVGGFANSLLEDNKRRWSGDHIVDPESVPGILFMNRKARHNHAQIIDLAPTILDYLGVTVPQFMEGKSLSSS